MEDVPDMAVKFAVYETLHLSAARLTGRDPSTLEDLLMGGTAGAAAAAATTPLDVLKTRMMCSASSRPTLGGAVRAVLAEGEGARAFFRGVGPRALSNGLNSAVFFCFFEAIRRVSLVVCQGAGGGAALSHSCRAPSQGETARIPLLS
jgi:solute carrier family 25 S-adenosylmethionine transporter 26